MPEPIAPPAVYRIVIPMWHPTKLNDMLSFNQWERLKAARSKKRDADLIACYALQAGVPKATGKRRVSLLITLGPKHKGADPDAYWKACLDGCVKAGLLIDDNRDGVELGTVDFDRAPTWKTTITLEDLPATSGGEDPQ